MSIEEKKNSQTFQDSNYIKPKTELEVSSAIREVYKKRRNVLVDAMSKAGWEIPSPDATMFAWAPIPKKYQNKGSLKFAKDLMVKADVAVSPGIAFGEYGEGFVRIGLVENEHLLLQAAKNVLNLKL